MFKQALLLICLFFCNTCAFLDFRSVKIPENVKEKFTLMIYIVGSDLESRYGAATDDMKEMMKIGSTKNLNIVVSTGGASAWKQKDISYIKVQRWLIEQKKKKKLEDAKDNFIADTDTLANFIKFSVKNYPADKYGIILWDHGGGSINGFGLDEHTGRMLRVDEVRDAFAKAYESTKAKFELIGFDSCLMATIETANVLAPYGKVLVASEETEPGHGWDYTAISKTIAENPRINGLKLGRIIAQSYEKHAYRNLSFKDITLSVIRLNKIKDAIVALDKLIEKAGPSIKQPARLQKIQHARSISEDYGNSPEEGTDMVDLMDLAYKLEDDFPEESQELSNKLREAISFRVRGRGRPNANGLSIYFPHKTMKNTFFTLDRFRKLNFSKKYETFLRNYSKIVSKDTTAIRFSGTVASESSKQSGNKLVSIAIKKQDMQQLDKAYSILAVAGSKKNPYVKFFMGLDDDVKLVDGRLSYEWKNSWLTLNGNFAAMYLLGKSQKPDKSIIKRYGIPILLNGEKMHLVVLYDAKEGYEVLGARRSAKPAKDKKSKAFPRSLIIPKKGDVITLRWRYHDPKKKKISFVSGKKFTVDGDLQIMRKSLKDSGGKFSLGFLTTDFAQNESISEYLPLD
ncbi:MAG: clostripain-related cysteine peptidase [Spirochaetota bacterium]